MIQLNSIKNKKFEITIFIIIFFLKLPIKRSIFKFNLNKVRVLVKFKFFKVINN